jgi:hypothetical protein
MKKKFQVCFILLIFLDLGSFKLSSQQVNSIYFLENVPARNLLNPAFQPVSDFYISLPVIGYSQFDVRNNSVALNDLFYKQNGKTISFLENQSGINHFLSKLQQISVLQADLQTNLLSFGGKTNNIGWNFSLIEKLNIKTILPADMFNLILVGTPDILHNAYDLNSLEIDTSFYTEAAFGISKQVNDKLTVGGKLKLLLGSANISNVNQKLNLNAGFENWNLSAQGSINTSSSSNVAFPNISLLTNNLNDLFKFTGMGLAFDMGAIYKFSPRLTLSSALLDVGFINWNKNPKNLNFKTNFNFNGLAQLSSAMSINQLSQSVDRLNYMSQVLDSVVTAFKNASQVDSTSNSYQTSPTAKFNFGIEYALWQNWLHVGCLSHTELYHHTMTEEITLSAITSPTEWLNAALSYSFFNGNFASIGSSVAITTGIFQWYIGADYIPFQKADFKLSQFYPALQGITVPLPYQTKAFNFSAGMQLVFYKLDKNQREKLRHVRELNDWNGLHEKLPPSNDCNCN